MTHRWLALAAVMLAGCGLVAGDSEVSGWPDVDLGVPVEVYKATFERDPHLHLFHPDQLDSADPLGAVLFFHGGGFATTRVEQFERQAEAAAENQIVGIVVEYRVTAEGITGADAVSNGVDAVA